MTLAWSFALLLALALGSFLNVCISRLPAHRFLADIRSHCPRCHAPVRARDNLPILSWLLLAGRCRDCRLPISPRYPLVELAYTALVAAALRCFGFSPAALAASVFCFLALGLLVMDLETMLLPDAFTLPGLMLGLAWAFASPGVYSPASQRLAALGISALSASGWALLLWGIRWSYYAVRRRHGLGLGDVKLVAMLAAWLGSAGMALTLVLAVVAAALTGLSQAALRRGGQAGSDGKAAEPWGESQLPLGAFLCAAGLYVLFRGEPTLKWYFSFWSSEGYLSLWH